MLEVDDFKKNYLCGACRDKKRIKFSDKIHKVIFGIIYLIFHSFIPDFKYARVHSASS